MTVRGTPNPASRGVKATDGLNEQNKADHVTLDQSCDSVSTSHEIALELTSGVFNIDENSDDEDLIEGKL
eukprot:CAMPEP_0184494102 /NCGR_PEP_ID=MMETSP0113_2-20130426/27799_1 /TAXON_ID=91329 /ORGANISM="Norrisiella sphaerica, Strain BC52" /LENGTH=69 /DNA_ID=CAMNT_0026879681 /DNA_START=141 /DNA_END=350 /DNA_ORIENTATION=+